MKIKDAWKKFMGGRAKITVLTGYDEKDAALLDGAGVDVILVGDSIGNVRLGYSDTTSVTMDDMLHEQLSRARQG